MKRILLSGGSGLLGRKLQELLPNAHAPTHQEMDVTNYNSIRAIVTKSHPEVFIHCAALVGTRVCKEDVLRCLNINIRGTHNVVEACMPDHVRLVYISTNYVFDGKLGNYSEADPISPVSEYAKSKAAGEILVSCYSNSLIIRTTFCSPTEWKFAGAFTDQYSSADTVDVIGPQISQASLSALTGIIHIGTDRKSQYDLAKTIDPSVRPISLDEMDLTLPRDTSLDCSLWKSYKVSH